MSGNKVDYPFHLYGPFKRWSGEMVMLLRDDKGITKGFFPIRSAADRDCPVGDRVVACLNGCAGIQDPEKIVPGLIHALELLIPCAQAAEIGLRAEGLTKAADKCLTALDNSIPLLAKLKGGVLSE